MKNREIQLQPLDPGAVCRNEVSVIVPVYNRADIVGRTLDTIKAQTYRPIHLILVDNNSKDQTYDVIKKWQEMNGDADFRITVTREAKAGAAPARNRGLSEVRSRKMMFFDSDDEMMPDMIATAVSAYDSHQNVGIVYWRSLRSHIGGGTSISHYTDNDIEECHLVHALLCTPSFIIDRDFFYSIGGWDESLKVWDDFELGVRIMLGVRDKKKAAIGIDKVLYRIISLENSITGTEFSSRAGSWEMSLDKIEKDIASGTNPCKDRLLKIVDYRRIILAAHYKKEGRPDLGTTLLENSLQNNRLTFTDRLLLRFAYHYTSKGLRGAWKLIKFFI